MSEASIIYIDEVVEEKENRDFRRDVLESMKQSSLLYADILNSMSEAYLVSESRGYYKSLKLLASMVKSCRDTLEKDVHKLNHLQSGYYRDLFSGNKQYRIETEMYELMDEIDEYEEEYEEIKVLFTRRVQNEK